MPSEEKYSILDFSPHLFWDVERDKLDFEKSKETIIYQVLEFGMMKDWKMLQDLYSKETLKEITLAFRQLDPVTLAFIANYLKIDKTEFRCYKNSQSEQSFWNS
jgi:hypothetical protein